jgi:serine protease Do
MKRYSSRSFALALAAALVLAVGARTAHAQPVNESIEIKTNAKFKHAFRDCITEAAKSTVRVQCDGKDTALGVVVTQNGFILTKASDLSGKITVKLKGGRIYDAQFVGHNDPFDLAMLKIDASGLTPVVWSESKVAPVGNFVASVGMDTDPIAVGVVSVSSRNVPKGQDPKSPNPNSGYLGVGLADATPGAKVAQVQPNTPADKAKLKVNDIIVGVGEKDIRDSEHLIKTLGKFKPGESVQLRLRRGDEEIELKVTLGKRPPDRADFQNNMGSKLSNRRYGIPVIIQHDSVVLPEDCGGPLVDLDGHVLGINISRAGRVETHAIPSEALQPLLQDLMSGKLAPKME